MFINVSIVGNLHNDTRCDSNDNVRLLSYAKCLQTKFGNRRDFSVKLMSMLDLHVDLTSKLH